MTEDEILQISNNISENEPLNHINKAQLVEVIVYFRTKLDLAVEQNTQLRCDMLTEMLKTIQLFGPTQPSTSCLEDWERGSLED